MEKKPINIGTLLIAGLVLLIILILNPQLLNFLLWAIIFFIAYICLKKDKKGEK